MRRILLVLALLWPEGAWAQSTSPPGIASINGKGTNTTLITPNVGVVTGGDVSAATASGTSLSTVAGQAASALQPSALGTGVVSALGQAVNVANGISVLNNSGCLILPGATGPTLCLASNGNWTITTSSVSLTLSSSGLTGYHP